MEAFCYIMNNKKPPKEMFQELSDLWTIRSIGSEYGVAVKRMSYISWLTQSHAEIVKAMEDYKNDVSIKIQEEIEELRLEILDASCEKKFNCAAIRFEKINHQFGEILEAIQVEHDGTSNHNSGEDEDFKIEPQVEQNKDYKKTTNTNIDEGNIANQQPDGVVVHHDENNFSDRNNTNDETEIQESKVSNINRNMETVVTNLALNEDKEELNMSVVSA